MKSILREDMTADLYFDNIASARCCDKMYTRYKNKHILHPTFRSGIQWTRLLKILEFLQENDIFLKNVSRKVPQ